MADQPERTPDRSPELDERTGRSAAAQRIQRQQEWVDHQLRIAMERGDFDNLPGAGKPIKDLGREYDYGSSTTVMDWEYLLFTARKRS